MNNTNIRNKMKKPFIRNDVNKANKLKSEPTKVSAVENTNKNEKSKKQQKNGNKKSFKNRHISTNNKNATRFKI